ncbi:MAG: cupin domain-containing protein [Jiangellales bacterium]
MSLDLLCSAPADVFANKVWGHRAWLSRADDLPGEVADWFSVDAADELLSRRGLRTPFVRLAKGGRIVAPNRYTGSGGVGATIGDQVMDDAVLRLFADGTTVVLQGVHRIWAPVGRLAAGLSVDLGHPVQVNAYITPPQSQGFASHYDTHDVFVLQVSGRKQWRVHDPVLDAPMPEEPWDQVADAVTARAAEPPVIEEMLEPGDCLYLPRGFLHSATALGGTSIHLTFGVHAVVERDVVDAVLAAVRDAGWRSSMPVGWDPTTESGVAEVGSLVAGVVDALHALDPTAVAAMLHDERSARQRPAPLSPLAQADNAAHLAAHHVVRLRDHLGARVDHNPEAGADQLVLNGRRRVAIEAGERPAVDALLTGDPLSVETLPLADKAQAVALAQRLLREGVLVVHDAAASQSPQ